MARKPKETEPAPEVQAVNVVMFGTILTIADDHVTVLIPNRGTRLVSRDAFTNGFIPELGAQVTLTMEDYNKSEPVPEGEDVPATSDESAIAPGVFTFKADVANVFKDTYELTVTNDEGGTATLSFDKDALGYEGKEKYELEAGYRDIHFTVPAALAKEKHLPEFLGATPVPAADIKAPADESEDEDAPQAAPYKKKLREETITVTVVLDPEEREACGQRMADAIERKEDLEDDLDTYRKSVNAQIKEVEKEISEAARLWRRGKEEREISCDVIADYNTGELVWCEKAHPHTERKRQRMTEKDRHLPLPFDAPSEPQEDQETIPTSETITMRGSVEEEGCGAITFRWGRFDNHLSIISRGDILGFVPETDGELAKVTVSRTTAIEAGFIPAGDASPTNGERSCGTCFHLHRQANEGEDDPCFDCGNDEARPNWRAEEEATEEA